MDSLEKNLVAKAKNGDPKAFEQLVKNHEAKIFNLLVRMTSNRTEAADLFQETFLSAWKNLKSFREEANFSTWLYRIAVNAVLMKSRKKKLKTVSLDAPVETPDDERQREVGDWSDNPLATLQNDELRKKLEKALEKMPEPYRATFILSDMQGLSNDAIKDILKITLPNVKSRLHRARLFMRKELSEYFKAHV